MLTIYVCTDQKDYEKTLELVDNTSPYALTGSIIAAIATRDWNCHEETGPIQPVTSINDKPTGVRLLGATFGARGSGTNDKAGANLLRWTSLRTIKETFVPPTDYRYPFLDKE